MVNTRNNPVTPVVTMESLQETLNEFRNAFNTLSAQINDHTTLAFSKLNWLDLVVEKELVVVPMIETVMKGKGWIFRCRQFFRINNIPEEMKVELAAMHVYDKALAWHQQLVKSTVQSYQDQFESLLNKVEATNSAMKPRYSPGYKCSGQVYSLEVIGESEEQEEDDSEHLVESNEEDDNVEMCNAAFDNSSLETPKISLNALSGVNSIQTMRVRGMVGKQPLHILVDS
ncbi:hypothetical protein Tco_1489927, partial [Tanacetum coccineum]